jgi:hypothetical protein
VGCACQFFVVCFFLEMVMSINEFNVMDFDVCNGVCGK